MCTVTCVMHSGENPVYLHLLQEIMGSFGHLIIVVDCNIKPRPSLLCYIYILKPTSVSLVVPPTQAVALTKSQLAPSQKVCSRVIITVTMKMCHLRSPFLSATLSSLMQQLTNRYFKPMLIFQLRCFHELPVLFEVVIVMEVSTILSIDSV